MPSLPEFNLIARQPKLEALASWTNNRIRDIYGMLNVETVHHDQYYSGEATNVPTVVDLCDIDLGITGEVNEWNGQTDDNFDIGYRIGDSILLKKMNIKFILTADPAHTSDIHRCRIIIFRDWNCSPEINQAPLAMQLLSLGSFGDSGNYIDAVYNRAYMDRFSVLADRTYKFNNSGSDTNLYHQYVFHRTFQSHVEYTDGNGDDTYPSNGKLYLLIVSNNGSNGTDWKAAARLSYIDN